MLHGVLRQPFPGGDEQFGALRLDTSVFCFRRKAPTCRQGVDLPSRRTATPARDCHWNSWPAAPNDEISVAPDEQSDLRDHCDNAPRISLALIRVTDCLMRSKSIVCRLLSSCECQSMISTIRRVRGSTSTGRSLTYV